MIDTVPKSQVYNLQALLNDYFDYYNRGIRIKLSDLDIASYLIWKEDLNKPMIISKAAILLQEEGYIGANNTDFEVLLPKGFRLTTKELNQMKILININKLASKTYKIITNG